MMKRCVVMRRSNHQIVVSVFDDLEIDSIAIAFFEVKREKMFCAKFNTTQWTDIHLKTHTHSYTQKKRLIK